jgi:hypothetical protein
MRMDLIAVQHRQMPLSFSVGDRVSHSEYGDGQVIGTYGAKLAVDFDHIGSKRVAIDSLTFAPWVSPEELAAIYAERDASRAKVRAAVERWQARQAAKERQAEKQRRRGIAQIIAFPEYRIVRLIRHGRVVKQRTTARGINK